MTQEKSEVSKFAAEAGRKVEYAKGLEGVILTDSSLSFVDGLAGKLIYRGVPIQELAEYSTFEETSYLLMFGEFPKKDELEKFDKKLKENRNLSPELLNMIKMFPKTAHPMEALRTGVSILGMLDPNKEDISREANIERAIQLIAKFATIVAAFDRHRNGKDFVPPNPNFNHAKNFLYMLRGKEPSELEAKAMDVGFILHVDHEMNASTLSCRVVISSLTDIYSAVTAGVGSLKGPLHGGANQEVMKMLGEIGGVDKTEAWIKDALSNKKKISGFGHRVYKYYDPRAAILKSYAEKFAEVRKDMKEWLEMAKLIEKIMIETLGEAKGIYPNVDFYSGLIYSAMDIPMDLFTPIFAIARVTGWTCQILEQLVDNRIYRPRAIYVGPIDAHYIPMDKR